MNALNLWRHAVTSTAVVVALCVGAPVAASPPVVEVRVANYLYLPSEIAVKVGTAVRWTNDEKRVSHSILFRGPQGFESERFFPGESWQRVFDKPGRYEYSCGPHPEMRGVVVVTD